MLHVFIYRIKYTLNERTALFWLIFFPISLSIFFWLAFGKLSVSNDTKLDIIPVASVNESTDNIVLTAMKESELFEFKKADSEESAAEMLKANEVVAIADFSDKVKLTFSDKGLQQSIIKTFADVCLRTGTTIENIVVTNPEVLLSSAELFKGPQSFTESAPVSDVSNIVVFFYALLANCALMGATLGSDCVNQLQRGQSELSERLGAAPLSRIKMFFASISAALIFHCIATMITCLFMRYVLDIGFGSSFGAVVLVCCTGSFTGIMLGSFVSSLIKARETVKGAVLIAFIMLSSTLAGMMSIELKYMVEEKLPILAKINPSTLLTDALQSLYYYGISGKFYTNTLILFVVGVILTIGTALNIKLHEAE